MRYRPEFFETIIVQSVPLWYMKLNTFATPPEPSYMYVRQHTSAYVSIRQHTSAYVAYVVRSVALWCMRLSIRQHTSAYVSIRQHTSAYVVRSVALWCMRLSTSSAPLEPSCMRQHTSAYVSIRQHTSAYVSIRQHSTRQLRQSRPAGTGPQREPAVRARSSVSIPHTLPHPPTAYAIRHRIRPYLRAHVLKESRQ
jgi:hypothetical protein